MTVEKISLHLPQASGSMWVFSQVTTLPLKCICISGLMFPLACTGFVPGILLQATSHTPRQRHGRD